MDRYRPNPYLFVTLLSLSLCSFLAPSTAFADSYTFVTDHCTGGCGSSPFGTITLTQNGTDDVRVVISLNDGNQFIHSGMEGSTLAFNLVGNPTISLSGVSLPGWSLDNSGVTSSLHFDGFGDFEYSVNCCNNQNGTSNAQSGPVQFDLTGAGLTPASFDELSTGGSPSVFFALDILSARTGNSGAVGTGVCTDCANTLAAVPEPGSLVLLGTGLSALGLWGRKRAKI